MNKEESFEIENNLMFKRITIYDGEECKVSIEPIIDKKTFIECYEKWIKPND